MSYETNEPVSSSTSQHCFKFQQGPDLRYLRRAYWRGQIFQIGQIWLSLGLFEKSNNLIIGFLMGDMPYLPNFNPLGLSHGLEEEPVVHQPSPGHLGEVGQPQYWVSHGRHVLPTKFEVSRAFPWP